MSDRLSTGLRGASALAKTTLVVVGVPIAIVRLWNIEPTRRPLVALHTLESSATWIHLALVVTGATWLFASASLIREAHRALRFGADSRSTWSARWVAAIVALALVVSAHHGGPSQSAVNGLQPATHSAVAPGHSTAEKVTEERLSHSASREKDPALLAAIGIGLLGAGALSRRVVALARLGESFRRPGERRDALPESLRRLKSRLRPLRGDPLVEWIDLALRVLSAALVKEAIEPPEVRLVRAGPHGIEFLLDRPLPRAPHPFVTEGPGLWWVLSPRFGIAECEELGAHAGRYVPWLVPIGDDGDAVYLLAIGPSHRLAIDGAPEEVDAAIAGVVLGLRTLPWAEELAVEMIGIEAPPLIEQCYQLNSSSQALLLELAREQPSSPKARLSSSWKRDPLVVVRDLALVDEVTLGAVNPVAGVIAPGVVGTTVIHVNGDHAVIDPFGVELNFSLPTPEQASRIDQLLVASAGGPAVVELASPELAATVVVELERPAAVEVKLLAPRATLAGEYLAPSPRDLDRVVELVTYLLLHEGVASKRATAAALFDESVPDQRLDNVVSAARRVLGETDEGTRLVVSAAEIAIRDASVSLDWTRFSNAAASARSAASDDAYSLLTSALELVTGEPLAEMLGGFGWLDAEGFADEMTATIVDAAHHLATLALARDDDTTARRAIATGRLVAPTSEMLVRDLMVACEKTGELDQVADVFFAHERALSSFGGAEPSRETRALFEAISAADGSGRH